MSTRNRRGLTRLGVLIAAVAALALVIPMACMNSAAEKQPFTQATIRLPQAVIDGKMANYRDAIDELKKASAELEELCGEGLTDEHPRMKLANERTHRAVDAVWQRAQQVHNALAHHITDPTQLEELSAFFPQLGRKSNTASVWESGPDIELTRRDGSVVKVSFAVIDGLQTWTEGQGDWPVKGDLQAFLDKLEKDQAATQPATQTAATLPAAIPPAAGFRAGRGYARQADCRGESARHAV